MVSGDTSMLGEVIAAALDKREFGYDSMEDAAETVGAAEHNKYMTQISWLSLLAAIGPMLGLLGTVVGMIQTFQAITLFGTGDPKTMAGGISTALMTTVLGLVVAIPMTLFHAIIAAKSKGIIHVLEEQSAGIIADHAERTGQALE